MASDAGPLNGARVNAARPSPRSALDLPYPRRLPPSGPREMRLFPGADIFGLNEAAAALGDATEREPPLLAGLRRFAAALPLPSALPPRADAQAEPAGSIRRPRSHGPQERATRGAGDDAEPGARAAGNLQISAPQILPPPLARFDLPGLHVALLDAPRAADTPAAAPTMSLTGGAFLTGAAGLALPSARWLWALAALALCILRFA